MIFSRRLFVVSRETQNTNLDFAEDFFSRSMGEVLMSNFFSRFIGLFVFCIAIKELFKNRNFLQILLRFFYDFFLETLFTFFLIGNFDAKFFYTWFELEKITIFIAYHF